MERRRVVITGLGAVTPLGLSAEESWQAAKEGRNGIAPITSYDTAGQKVTLAGEVKGFDPDALFGKAEAKRMARFAQFTMAAVREALADAGMTEPPADADRCGVNISSGIGGMVVTQIQHEVGKQKGFDRVSPFYIPMTISNMAAGRAAIESGFRGMCTCPTAACAGGTNAVGDAFHYIRDGYAEVMLAGGAESCICDLGIGGFTAMKALTTETDPEKACSPFDARRSGFVAGEGAAVLMLEELEHAKARGAKIIAEVVGYGASCDAYHITAPRPDGSGGAAAMAGAVADAGITPEEVDYINAHGTSTHLNDVCETLAIRTVFGAHADEMAVSSTKSMTGHLLGAAGAVEAMFCAQTLRDSFLPPTIHYVEPDPECMLDVVPNVGRSADIRYALSNSLGFGGHNASILLKKWEG